MALRWVPTQLSGASRHRFALPGSAVEYMYLDIKGLVTLGVGNLIDVEKASDKKGLEKVMQEVVTLPFVYKEGQPNAGKPATKNDIEAEWKKVKGEKARAKGSYCFR